ncbi:MAG: YgjP-like metallopeptidase domain-containing protein [Sphingobacterium composti]
MYLEFGDKTYFIHLKTDIDSIRIKKIDPDVIHLNVPALLPQDNLILYIQKELPKVISDAKKIKRTSITELEIFDKKYPIRIINLSTSYIANDILYTNTDTLKSKIKIEELKLKILRNTIDQLLSNLEEELNVILPVIKLKKLKTKYYSICPTNEYITYSKTLIDKSKDFISYVVIMAVGRYLLCTEEQSSDLINRHVLNPKHCEKVYNYEQ